VKGDAAVAGTPSARAGRPSAVIDTRVVYCGDNLEQLAKLPDACVDLVYIDPPFNSNRNYEVFWGETPPQREAGVRGPAREHAPPGVHRLHAAARGGAATGPRALEGLLVLLPL